MSISPSPKSRGRLINLKTNLKSLRFGGDRPANSNATEEFTGEYAAAASVTSS